MKPQLPKKWSRRVFAIYMAATLLGGAVLVVFLILLGLLYWMNAKTHMKDWGNLVYPESGNILFAYWDDRGQRTATALPDAVTAQVPDQVRHLLNKGMRDPQCRISLVVSLTPEGQTVLAVDLSKYPGMFRLVRRDLERKAEKGQLHYALSYYRGTTIFVPQDTSSTTKAMAISGTMVLLAQSTQQLEKLIDHIEGRSEATMVRDEDGKPVVDVIADADKLPALVAAVTGQWRGPELAGATPESRQALKKAALDLLAQEPSMRDAWIEISLYQDNAHSPHTATGK